MERSHLMTNEGLKNTRENKTGVFFLIFLLFLNSKSLQFSEKRSITDVIHKRTRGTTMRLTDPQNKILKMMYDVILDPSLTTMERVLFVKTKNEIEFGRTFETEVTALLKELNHIPNSKRTTHFRQELSKVFPFSAF